MRILLFGSTGMLGTAVELICKHSGIDYIGLDHSSIDITDFKAAQKLIDRYSPDVVINSVAIIGINICESNPIQAFNVNSFAVYHMARYCALKKIIFVQPSSHAVFDGLKNGYYTEEDLPAPLNIYSSSKYLAEILTINLCKRYYVVRFPTMFGVRRNKNLGFVDKVIEKVRKGEELKIADDKIDSMTYALDVAGQLITMLKRQMPYGVYHLANTGIVSYYDFVKKLIDLLGVDARLIRAKDSDFPALGYKPLKTAMRSIKLEPMRSWEDALSEYVEDCLEQEEI